MHIITGFQIITHIANASNNISVHWAKTWMPHERKDNSKIPNLRPPVQKWSYRPFLC